MEKIVKERSIDRIFAVTDAYALEVIDFLKKHHISIPDDVQVVGFDGEKSSKRDQIEISTIRQPIEAIGKESVAGIIHLINKESIVKEILLPVHFIQGKTTKRQKDS